jgi:hypothetical protein
MRKRLVVLAALIGLTVAWPSTSLAGHHLWKLTHIFSNASGDVQYIQLFVTDNAEAGVGPFTVTTSNGHTFNFGNNLGSTNTANTWILIGTPNVEALSGVKPDYTIPAGFFPTGGGTLTYATTVDSWTYGAVPTDGVHELKRDGTTPVNVATNFPGKAGTVVLAGKVPALPTAGVVVLVGALLLAGSGLLRRRPTGA